MVAMFEQLSTVSERAPREWRKAALAADYSCLHQLAPYIGKLKPVIARQLLEQFTSVGDIVLDCFSGSGTIPLEAALMGRRTLAFDANPYAVTLTRAKLEAPYSLEVANELLAQRLADSQKRPRYDRKELPLWVRKFFHPTTLQNAVRFADECIEKDDPFLLACLLSVLHHQRPGFLSYPSSHLVPYLRDRKFPKGEFPDMYTERKLAPRLAAKLARTYKYGSPIDKANVLRIEQISVADLKLDFEVDAIVTSPPYMNALDYVRDNRLRMWFLDRGTVDYSPEPTERQAQSDEITASFAKNALRHLRKGGNCILVVGETVLRKRVKSHPAERILAKLTAEYPTLRVERVIRDVIPDIRRSRRTGAATKRELVLVLKKR
jgi:hypothetical protein